MLPEKSTLPSFSTTVLSGTRESTKAWLSSAFTVKLPALWRSVRPLTLPWASYSAQTTCSLPISLLPSSALKDISALFSSLMCVD